MSTYDVVEVVAEDTTLGAVAKRHNVAVGDVWYTPTTKETVDADRGVVLVHNGTKEAIYSRSDILRRMNIYGDPSQVLVEPRSIPEGYTLCVQGGRANKKILASTSIVKLAPQAASCVEKNEKKMRTRRTKQGLSGTPAPEPSSAQDAARSSRTPKHTKDTPNVVSPEVSLTTSVMRRGPRIEPPLHNVGTSPSGVLADMVVSKVTLALAAPNPNVVVEPLRPPCLIPVAGMKWERPHEHVLCARFYPADSLTASRSGSSRIAGFAIENTLMRTNLFERGPDAWKLSHPVIPAALEALASERGYRIVLFGSYPSLHHATASHIEEVLGRIASFVRTHLSSLTVTVMLSVVSLMQPSLYTMPSPGLWQLFLSHFNEGIPPSPTFSFFVGSLAGRSKEEKLLGVGSEEDSNLVCDDIFDTDLEFANSCGVSFYPEVSLYDGTLHGTASESAK